MHIAYSALRSTNERPRPSNSNSARYQGYLAACKKHRQTIAAIQEYLPGWRPTAPDGHSGNHLNHLTF